MTLARVLFSTTLAAGLALFARDARAHEGHAHDEETEEVDEEEAAEWEEEEEDEPVRARKKKRGRRADRADRPASGVPFLVVGGIFTGIGVVNLATAPVCKTDL